MFYSILDTDQYTLTQQQAILKSGYGAVPVRFRFKCRNENVDLTAMYNEISDLMVELESLFLTKDQYDFLRSIRYFSSEYLDFLKAFRFDLRLFSMYVKGNELQIEINGPWFYAMPFEIPVLYIISETYSSFQRVNYDFAFKKFTDKMIGLPEGFRFADFGTRRRSHNLLQNQIVAYCAKNVPQFIGTSNLDLAMRHNVKAIGTMSHQWIQAHQQLNYRVSESQKMAFENWVKVYRGDLGIALADTINTDAFLRDFDDALFYKLFDGVREDSASDPILFGHKMVNFYLERKINPKTKTIIFSNGLTFEKAKKIYAELHNLINVSFGIGTELTNDTGSPRLDIVMKMIECNGQPVAKISNDQSKGMCEDPKFLSYLKSVFRVE